MLNVLSKTDKRIFKIIRFLLFFCAGIPIFASSLFLFPYTAPKAFLFRIIIEIAFVLYLYLILKNNFSYFYLSFFQKTEGVSPLFKRGARGDFLKKNVISLVIVLFVLFWLFSSSVVNYDANFWGTYDRMIGFWGILHFAIFYFLLISVFREKKDWVLLLKISVGASFIIAVLGILQRFTDLGGLLPQTSRITSLIGNASFLATYLLVNLFFILYLFLKEVRQEQKTNKPLRILAYIFIFAVIFCAMFLTATRGALLGFFAGAAVFSAIFSFWGKGGTRKYFTGVLLFFVLLAVFGFVFRESSFFRNNSVLRRFSSMTLADSSVQNRLMLWRGAWHAWQEKPVLGWGSESFEIAINKYFDPRLNYDEAWYDRAHNFIFDYGVAGGWLGFLSYSGLFVASGFCLVRIRKKDFIFFSVFLSFFAAYLIQALFAFDIFSSYLTLFLAFGMIHAYSVGSQTPAGAIKRKNREMNFIKKGAMALAIIFVAVLIFSYNLKPLYASYLANSAISLPAENYQEENTLSEKAISLNTFATGEIVYQITLDYLNKMNSEPAMSQNNKFFEITSGVLEKNILNAPQQLKNYIALAWLNLYFSGAEPGRIDKAIELAQKAKSLSPAKKDGYMVLAAAYAISNNNAKAQEVVFEAEKVDAGLGNIIKEYLSNF